MVVLDRERVLLSKGKGEGLFFMRVKGNGVCERGEIFAWREDVELKTERECFSEKIEEFCKRERRLFF